VESESEFLRKIWWGVQRREASGGVIIATVPMMTITTTLQDPFGELPPWALDFENRPRRKPADGDSEGGR